MSPRRWRWEERDFGLRFRVGTGRARRDHYQGRGPSEFYVVPAHQCKLDARHADRLTASAAPPRERRVVANPWRCYDRHWDWIVTDDGICLNWAGCLDREAVDRREDRGVARARELVANLAQRQDAVPIDLSLVRRVHHELMGEIYPFAGEWRTVELTKGEGPVKWPLPLSGIGPPMDEVERDVLARTAFLSDDDDAVLSFTAELMGELLAVHPFREGNGRLAFALGNLVLMQNRLLPIDSYDRPRDEERYLAACERGRVHRDHAPLGALLGEWEDEALERWRAGDEL